MLYLHITDDRYKVFQNNSSFKEEYKIEDKLDKIAFISKCVNSLSFHNNNIISDDSFSMTDSNYYSKLNGVYTMENIKLLFIKEYDPDTNLLQITKVIQFDSDLIKEDVDFVILENQIASQLNKTNVKDKINFLVEKTSFKDPSNHNNNILLTQENILNILNKTNSLILIPYSNSLTNIILEKVDDIYNNIYIDIYNQAKNVDVIRKLKINIKQAKEEIQIKRIILEKIKSDKLYDKIIDIKSIDHYSIDVSKKLIKLTDEVLENMLTIDHLELIQERETNPKYAIAFKDIPINRYINTSECRIEFNLVLCPKNSLPDTYYQEISLYDEDNNRSCILSCVFPKKIKKCRDVIDYLSPLILNNASSESGEQFEKEDYYFILQNPKTGYIYQMVYNNNNDFLQHADKIESI